MVCIAGAGCLSSCAVSRDVEHVPLFSHSSHHFSHAGSGLTVVWSFSYTGKWSIVCSIFLNSTFFIIHSGKRRLQSEPFVRACPLAGVHCYFVLFVREWGKLKRLAAFPLKFCHTGDDLSFWSKFILQKDALSDLGKLLVNVILIAIEWMSHFVPAWMTPALGFCHKRFSTIEHVSLRPIRVAMPYPFCFDFLTA